MKRSLLTIWIALAAVFAQAQPFDTVNVYDIQFVTPGDLALCNDTSSRLGDTVTVVAYVVTPGNHAELGSGSITIGYRPLMNVVDTSNGGVGGPFMGMQIHGVTPGGVGVDVIDNLNPGDLVYVTGVVSQFRNETQLNPLGNSSVVVPQLGVITPQPLSISVSDLNDNASVNKPETGEQWEGSFVELTNLTVVSKNTFGSSPERTHLVCQDASGNRVLLYDKFLGLRKLGEPTVNANSPSATGSFDADNIPVGANLATVRGVIDHDANGCTGATGTNGYRISPVAVGDVTLGATPPIISNLMRDQIIPNSTQTVTVTADIVDADGTVSSVNLYYTTSPGVGGASFTTVAMTGTGTPDQYEATIPAFNDGDLIGYYIEAVDNSNDSTIVPIQTAGLPSPNVFVYSVRDNGPLISDIQRSLFPNSNDASPLLDETVTVTGVVTATRQDYDLGYIYIQDPNETEFAGLWLQGAAAALDSLQRHEVVTVTGLVQETAQQVTFMNVTDVVRSCDRDTIMPMTFDPNDPTRNSDRNMEKYEGMLLQYVNLGGGSVYITEDNRDNFGAWMVSSTQGALRDNSSEIMTGIAAAQNFSSLWVSPVNNDTMSNSDAPLEISDPVEVQVDMTMDTLIGVITSRFSRYKMTPRNNDDFRNFSVNISAAQLAPTDTCETGSGGGTGINELTATTTLRLYPNPSNNVVNIVIESNENVGSFEFELFDVAGRRVLATTLNQSRTTLNTLPFENGLYYGRMLYKGEVIQTEKLVIQH